MLLQYLLPFGTNILYLDQNLILQEVTILFSTSINIHKTITQGSALIKLQNFKYSHLIPSD